MTPVLATFLTNNVHKILLSSITLALVANVYTFLYKQNYLFTVETPCDPSTHRCFVRNCDTEECPPNGLTYFRQFTLAASEFSSCSDNSCASKCFSQASMCTEIICGANPADACSTQ